MCNEQAVVLAIIHVAGRRCLMQFGKKIQVVGGVVGLMLLAGVTSGCAAKADDSAVIAAANKAAMAADKAEAAAKSAADAAMRAEAAASKAEALFHHSVKKK